MHLSFITLSCFDSTKMSKQINLAVPLLKVEHFCYCCIVFHCLRIWQTADLLVRTLILLKLVAAGFHINRCSVAFFISNNK